MRIEKVPVKSLAMDPANVRTHNEKNLKAIKASLSRFGQQKPIVVDPNGVVVAGNGTLAAASALGWSEINTVSTELDGAESIAYAIADNRTGELAEWDDDALAKQLSALQIEADELLEAAGFTSEDLDAMVDDVEDLDIGHSDPDEIPELQKETRTKVGQIWELGRHRLMCGDSSQVENVKAMLGSELVDLVLTDPPYNLAQDQPLVAQTANTKIYSELIDSGWDKDFDPKSFIENLPEYIKDDCFVCVFTSHLLFGKIIDSLNEKFKKTGHLVWCKQNPMPALMKVSWTHATELIAYSRIGKPTFNFPKLGHCLNYIVSTKQPRKDHPTSKPVELLAGLISQSSPKKGLVLDLYLGSGSTLIAAEQTGRACYGMDIEPSYCDLTLRRWEEFTGETARLMT